MHEFNICQSIVDTIKNQLSEQGMLHPARCRTTVVVGALRPIIPESLASAFSYLTKGIIAEGSELVITRPRAKGKCQCCGSLTEIADRAFLCGRCGAETAEIIGGRELYIEKIELCG